MRLPGRSRNGAGRDDRLPTPDAGTARIVEALETLAIGVLVEDGAGRTVAVNERAKAPLGDLQADALARAALARVLHRAHAGDVAIETLELRGSPPRVVEITARPLEAGGVVATLVDVSERRQLDAVRRDFVANVNHELRTPIGALALLAEALEDEGDPEVISRLASRISTEAERARALIEDLLDFSRIDADRAQDHTRVAMADVLAAASERVMPKAVREGVRLEVTDQAAGSVIGDRDQLVSAVVNLIDNAVKYSDEGSVVDISAHGDDGWVDVVVADHGIGIPSRDLDRVFERFYRVDRARDRKTGGTGLGLAIVRHVATNHGGRVSVQSREGVGSTFTLRLPRTDN